MDNLRGNIAGRRRCQLWQCQQHANLDGGGTLQMVGDFNFDSSRPIVIDTAGGTLDTQGYNTTIAGSPAAATSLNWEAVH